MPHRNVVLLFAALLATGLLVGAYLNGRLAANYAVPPSGETPADLVPEHAPILGARNGSVTIVEFFDPACEGCRAFYPAVKRILAAHPNDARLVLRYAPFHRGSEEAVRILHAALLQGKFEAVLDALIEQQSEWASHAEPNIERAWTIAQAAGLDIARARIDGFSEGADEALERDKADTRSQLIQVTPTFLVNGRRVVALSEDALHDLVVEEIDRARTRSTGTEGN